MFRNVMLALTALTIVGAAALAPTAASAKWKGGHHGHHGHHGWGKSFYYGGGAAYVGYAGYSNCWVKRWVDTPYGPRLQRVYVCY